MIWIKGQKVIVPGFGLMDGEFTFYVSRVDRKSRRIHWHAGLMSTTRLGVPMGDFRWDSDRKRWVHKDLPLDVEA